MDRRSRPGQSGFTKSSNGFRIRVERDGDRVLLITRAPPLKRIDGPAPYSAEIAVRKAVNAGKPAPEPTPRRG